MIYGGVAQSKARFRGINRFMLLKLSPFRSIKDQIALLLNRCRFESGRLHQGHDGPAPSLVSGHDPRPVAFLLFLRDGAPLPRPEPLPRPRAGKGELLDRVKSEE